MDDSSQQIPPLAEAQKGEALLMLTPQQLHNEQAMAMGALAKKVAVELANILSALRLELHFLEPSTATLPSEIAPHFERLHFLRHQIMCYVQPLALGSERVVWREVLEESVELVSNLIRKSDATVLFEFDTEMSDVTADANRIQHMVVSLIVSAIQTMPSQKNKLVIGTQMTPNLSTVYIQVSEAVMPRRNREPVSLSSSYTPIDDLSIELYGCQEIARENGWSLKADWSRSEGLRYSILIPATAAYASESI